MTCGAPNAAGGKSLRSMPFHLCKLCKIEEASELLGVCTKTVYSLIKKGDLKKLNVGRLFRIPKREILRYLGIHETK